MSRHGIAMVRTSGNKSYYGSEACVVAMREYIFGEIKITRQVPQSPWKLFTVHTYISANLIGWVVQVRVTDGFDGGVIGF